jgi:hypothetical protein
VEKYSVCAKFLVNEFKGVFELSLGETVEGGLFKDAIDTKIRPLFEHINAFPENSPLEIPFFAFPLIDKGPGEITTNEFFISPLIKRLNHTGLATANLKYFHILINELKD